jgi:hypothetical protein
MQTALGYLRWTRAEFQGGVLIRKAKSAYVSAQPKFYKQQW